jgi:hypothetical protein
MRPTLPQVCPKCKSYLWQTPRTSQGSRPRHMPQPGSESDQSTVDASTFAAEGARMAKPVSDSAPGARQRRPSKDANVAAAGGGG